MAAHATKIIRVDADLPSDQDLLPAAAALRQGELVAFPTETVYGLGANALDPEAVKKIFIAKGRPDDNPLIVHIASLADLKLLVREIPPLAVKLFQTFSPGPLTLILLKSAAVPSQVTAGLDTVAIRIPAHPVARRLIELAGVPVAAPSANRSGRPSPTRAWHVEADLNGRIPFIIEAGSSRFGLESTVVDITGHVPVILRPGAITAAALREIAGTVIEAGTDAAGLSAAGKIPQSLTATPRSPGMKYRHYAPKAQVLIVENAVPDKRFSQAAERAAKILASGKRLGFFSCRQGVKYLTDPWMELDLDDSERIKSGANAASFSFPGTICIFYGPEPDAAAAGAALFDALRSLDQAGVEVIIAEGLSERGLGAAYMNRLRKAASSDNLDPKNYLDE